jgi:hypothetical protein
MPSHADKLAQMGEIVNREISPILCAEFLTFVPNFSPLCRISHLFARNILLLKAYSP